MSEDKICRECKGNLNHLYTINMICDHNICKECCILKCMRNKDKIRHSFFSLDCSICNLSTVLDTEEYSDLLFEVNYRSSQLTNANGVIGVKSPSPNSIASAPKPNVIKGVLEEVNDHNMNKNDLSLDLNYSKVDHRQIENVTHPQDERENVTFNLNDSLQNNKKEIINLDNIGSNRNYHHTNSSHRHQSNNNHYEDRPSYSRDRQHLYQLNPNQPDLNTTWSARKNIRYSTCLEHQDEILNYYCYDDIKLVCAECIIEGNYKNKHCAKVSKAYPSIKTKLLSLVSSSSETARALDKMKKKIEERRIVVKSSADIAKSTVLDKITQLKEKLHSIQSDFEKQINDKVQNELNGLNSYTSEYDNKFYHVENGIRDVQGIIKEMDEMELVDYYIRNYDYLNNQSQYVKEKSVSFETQLKPMTFDITIYQNNLEKLSSIMNKINFNNTTEIEFNEYEIDRTNSNTFKRDTTSLSKEMNAINTMPLDRVSNRSNSQAKPITNPQDPRKSYKSSGSIPSNPKYNVNVEDDLNNSKMSRGNYSFKDVSNYLQNNSNKQSSQRKDLIYIQDLYNSSLRNGKVVDDFEKENITRQQRIYETVERERKEMDERKSREQQKDEIAASQARAVANTNSIERDTKFAPEETPRWIQFKERMRKLKGDN